ncbi:DUF2249 domain-containing protein [Agromyces neolithicus]|uniref:DUF2249 domain-containing protein n=1 Tax=Agromyces neolithicus TaxID=269420 RepID=A0ABN2M508_9MICO
MAPDDYTLLAADASALTETRAPEGDTMRTRRVFSSHGTSVSTIHLRRGAAMPTHASRSPILVQVLDGHVAMVIAHDRVDLPEGALLHVDAGAPHSVEAVTDAHLLLIVLGAGRVAPAIESAPAIEARQAASDVPVLRPPQGATTLNVIGQDDEPVLDVRDIPRAIRHATVLGALTAIAPGAALVIVAPHDPLRLLAEIDERWPSTFAVSYLDRGLEHWRLRLTHAPSTAAA